MFLVAPLAIGGGEDGWVKSVKMQQMELGEPDASGRRRPVPVEGGESEIEADIVIMSIGTMANPLLTSTCPDLKLNKWGNIEVDDNQMTSLRGCLPVAILSAVAPPSFWPWVTARTQPMPSTAI